MQIKPNPDDRKHNAEVIGAPLELRCGLMLKNRLVKAAMSDSLGDGRGGVTKDQVRLYERWAAGGVSLAIVGEVQVDARYPEKPGNLVLDGSGDQAGFGRLARAGSGNGAHLWAQLGHAGALSDVAISDPAGPSALDVDGLACSELSVDEIEELPGVYAAAARRAQSAGFSGVEVHAGHGFLLSQFLSPLFNHRRDHYGGPIEARSRIILDIVRQIRLETGSEFAIGIKINATDQLEGGLTEPESLILVGLLDQTTIDVIDVSGGTYFPGAASSSDRVSTGPYFLDFAQQAKERTSAAVMLTGGFKSHRQAIDTVQQGATDLVGLARTMALDPDLPTHWLASNPVDPDFPRFESPPPGGMTAWYTMRLSALAGDQEDGFDATITEALDAYESRDRQRLEGWRNQFAHQPDRS